MNTRIQGSILKSSLLLLSAKFSTRILQFLTTVSITYILAPEQIGLVAFSLSIIEFTNISTELGFTQALIQTRKNTNPILPSFYTFNLLRGLFLALTIVATAKPISHAFDNTEAYTIITILALQPLLLGAQNPTYTLLAKKLKFQKIAVTETISSLTNIIVTLSIAYTTKRPEAMAIGYVTGSLTQTVSSYLLSPWKPKLTRNLTPLKPLIKFSIWIYLSGIITFSNLNFDKLYIAAKESASTLGVYFIAAQLSLVVVNDFGKTIGRVLFPTYSNISDDINSLKHTFTKSSITISSLLIPICTFLFIFRDPLTLTVFNDRWIGISIYIAPLSIAAMIRSINISFSGVFWSLGKSKVNFATETIRLTTLVGFSLYLYPRFGIISIAYATIASNAATLISNFYLLNRYNLLSKTYFYLLSKYAIAGNATALLMSLAFEQIITSNMIFSTTAFAIITIASLSPLYLQFNKQKGNRI